MIRNIKLLDLKTVTEFKEEFIKLSRKKLTLLSYDLVIFKEDFDHCWFEYGHGADYKQKFSIRRARRIPLIDLICNHQIDYEIIFESKRNKKTVAFISDLAEFCLIVLPITNNKKRYFRLVTIIPFGKSVEPGIKKLIESGEKIQPKNLKRVFPKESEG